MTVVQLANCFYQWVYVPGWSQCVNLLYWWCWYDMKTTGLIFLYWIWDVLLLAKEFCLWMNGDSPMMRTAWNINQDHLFDKQVWYYLGARTSDNYQNIINKMNNKRDKLLGIVMVYLVAITYLLLVSPLSLANVQIILQYTTYQHGGFLTLSEHIGLPVFSFSECFDPYHPSQLHRLYWFS